MSKLIIYLHHVCVIAKCINLIINRLNQPLNYKNEQRALPRHKNLTQKLHDSLVAVHAKPCSLASVACMHLIQCLNCSQAEQPEPYMGHTWGLGWKAVGYEDLVTV